MSIPHRYWTWSAISFVILAALVGAIVDHYTHRVLRRVDEGLGYTPNPEGVREFLAEHPGVASWRPGDETEGGSAVTVALLDA